MPRKTLSYRRELLASLKNRDECAAYLNAALEDGDTRALLKALRNVAVARGGLGKLAARTRLSRVSLYRMLSDRGNPELASLGKILRYFGLRLAVQDGGVAAVSHR